MLEDLCYKASVKIEGITYKVTMQKLLTAEMFTEIIFLWLKDELNLKIKLRMTYSNTLKTKTSLGGWAARRIYITITKGSLENSFLEEDLLITVLHEVCHQLRWEERTSYERRQDYQKYTRNAIYRSNEEVSTWKHVIQLLKKYGIWTSKVKRTVASIKNGKIAIDSMKETQ